MAEHLFQPGDQLGHYRLTEKIGKGGQGEVWLAHDERFDRHVALKILPAKALADSGARDRFRREARAVGKLNHPNIATAHDFDTTPVDYLVTEYVSGSGLDQRLKAGALPEDSVIALGIQLASGLEAAHREGIIHRDLKPGNLRITEAGTLKILDFGLAEMFDPTKDFASLETITINMTLTGTLPYMAPEQFGGIADQRTDLWSVGAVLYEMATGRLPFTETQIQELRDAIQRKQPPNPRVLNPAVSAGLEQVILHCLKKNPSQRYQSATELREDLMRLSEGRKTKDAEKIQGRRFAIAALATVLVVSAIAGIHYWPLIRSKLWPSSQEAAAQFRLLAILPVEATGQGPGDNALVRGMAETVSARIAQGTNGQRLQLIPPSELIARDARTTDAARREFGVDRVLELSVQRNGDKVRVTCSLIDSKTHQVLNACTVTGEEGDLFALQDTLAGEVIAMLPQGDRSEQGESAIVHAAEPPKPASYEFYLKGRGYLLEYQKPENIDVAITEFEKALKADPNYAPALAGLGQAYWTGFQRQHRPKNWLDKALDKCQAALKVNPVLPEGHACLGDVYNSTGQYDLAVKSLENAARLKPDDVPILGDLGDAYDKGGRTSDAEATYQHAIKLRPDYWAVYNWLGFFYFAHGRYSDAADQFRKVTEISPQNARGYSNLAAMYLLLGNYKESITASRRSVELQPSKDAYENLGAAYYYLRQYPAAIETFESARKIDDRDALAVGNLGDALYWSGARRNEAAAAYKMAVKLVRDDLAVNPKDAVATAYLAEYSSMLEDRDSALQSTVRALQLDPKNPEVLFRSALVYNHFGDSAKALEQLKKAVDAGFSVVTIRDTPDFDSLVGTPEFHALTASR